MWAVVTFSLHVRAESKSLEQSPALYRAARAEHSAEVEVLLARAYRQVDTALHAFPANFRVTCERTQALRLPVDSPAVRKGQRRALTLFSQQALARRDALDRALTDLERARKLEPGDPEIASARARVLALWEEPASIDRCEVRQRTAATIQALLELHALRPLDVSTANMLELGSLYARTGEYDAAAAAARRALSLAFEDSERSAAYTQLAQVTMLAGDAPGAVPNYRRAITLATPGRARALVQLGLAVALDRSGEHSAALEVASQALTATEHSLEWLAPDNVQFEPASERFMYEALAHEALARLAPDARAPALEAAAQGYAEFLARADDAHLYRNAAEADLLRLSR